MKRAWISSMCLLAASTLLHAQSMDDLNIQLHGYVTQGFLYSSANNFYTTTSSDGSPAWTDAVLNVTANPDPKLRFGIQARYFLLGNYGNRITLDWVSADCKFSDKLGIRVGKLKTPWGLFNEVQDIDPAYSWALLPEPIYPIDDRNSYLTHYGGIVYGAFDAEQAGKFEYRVYGGEGLYPSDDGYYIAQAEAGFALPNDIHGLLYGGALHWRTPLRGLMVGASDLTDAAWSAVQTYSGGGLSATGTYALAPNSQPNVFAQYEKKKLMIAAEWQRSWGEQTNNFSTAPALSSVLRNDDRGWYVMATYKLANKLTIGAYDTGNSDHEADLGPDRYFKDWVASGRYDFNSAIYLKAEGHFIRGTGLALDDNLNANPQTNSNLLALKMGVSF